MPPKRSTKAATRPAAQVNGVATSKATATKATQKPTTTTKPVATGASTATANNGKRKADEDVEDSPPPKRAVGQSKAIKKPPAATKTAAAPKRVTAAKKPATAKKPAAIKKKTIINTPPTDILDVYVFGEGAQGELGLGNERGQLEVKRPRLNPLLSAARVGVVQVAVGGMHTAVLTHDNRILTWGVNDQGALGRDTTWDGGLRDIAEDKDNTSSSDSDSDAETAVNPREATPAEVDMTDVPEGTIFTQLVCSDSASFALTEEGLVYGWGTFRGNDGIIGFAVGTVIQTRPALVKGLKKVTKLACGANHVLALDTRGAVFAWGSGQQNQLGRRIVERMKANGLTPREFGLPKSMVNVGAGSYHSFAIDTHGQVYAWGLNSYGETGVEKGDEQDAADVHHPSIVTSLEGKGTVICIEGGAHHTIAVTDRGECLVWGRLDGCQLGLQVDSLPNEQVIRDSANKPRILTVPTQIPGIDAVYAAAGSDHCLAVSRDGKVYAWGFSATYQTGLGTDKDVEVATQIDNTAVRGKKIVWAGAGGQFSVIAGLSQPVVNGDVNGRTIPANGHVEILNARPERVRNDRAVPKLEPRRN